MSEAAIAEAVAMPRTTMVPLCPEGGAVLAGWRLALDGSWSTATRASAAVHCANGNNIRFPDTSERIELARVEVGSL